MINGDKLKKLYWDHIDTCDYCLANPTIRCEEGNRLLSGMIYAMFDLHPPEEEPSEFISAGIIDERSD